MHRGYFPLYRKFQDNFLWKEKRVFSKAEAWIDILWEVQHEDQPRSVVFGMKVLMCNYGESLKSLRTWSKRWGWGRGKTQRFLFLLKSVRQIDTVNETVTTRIKVLNYRQYDPRYIKTDTQAGRKRDASGTQADTDKKVKKVKTVKKKRFRDIEKHIPKCPHDKIIKLWNDKMVPFGSPEIKAWEKDRKAHLKARWDEKEERQNLEWWGGFFDFIKKQDFLMGRVEPNGTYDKPFRLTLARAVQSSNQLATIIETGNLK